MDHSTCICVKHHLCPNAGCVSSVVGPSMPVVTQLDNSDTGRTTGLCTCCEMHGTAYCQVERPCKQGKTITIMALVLQNILFWPLPMDISPSDLLDYIALNYLAMLLTLFYFYSTWLSSNVWSEHIHLELQIMWLHSKWWPSNEFSAFLGEKLVEQL
jgi:hypothetical protein